MEYEVCRKSRFAKKSLGLLYTYNVIFLMVWLSEINITILAKSILFCRFCYMFVTEWLSEENAKDACKRDWQSIEIKRRVLCKQKWLNRPRFQSSTASPQPWGVPWGLFSGVTAWVLRMNAERCVSRRWEEDGAFNGGRGNISVCAMVQVESEWMEKWFGDCFYKTG